MSPFAFVVELLTTAHAAQELDELGKLNTSVGRAEVISWLEEHIRQLKREEERAEQWAALPPLPPGEDSL